MCSVRQRFHAGAHDACPLHVVGRPEASAQARLRFPLQGFAQRGQKAPHMMPIGRYVWRDAYVGSHNAEHHMQGLYGVSSWLLSASPTTTRRRSTNLQLQVRHVDSACFAPWPQASPRRNDLNDSQHLPSSCSNVGPDRPKTPPQIDHFCPDLPFSGGTLGPEVLGWAGVRSEFWPTLSL